MKVNWREGLKRLSKGVSVIYAIVAVWATAYVIQDVARPWDPGREAFLFLWSAVPHALVEGFKCAAVFGLVFLVFGAAGQGIAWIVKGFSADPA